MCPRTSASSARSTRSASRCRATPPRKESIRLLDELRDLCDHLGKHLEPGSKDAKLLADLAHRPRTTSTSSASTICPSACAPRTSPRPTAACGLLLAIDPGKGFDGSTYRGLAKSVILLRTLALPPGAMLSGSEVIFVEMMEAVVREGPRAASTTLARPGPAAPAPDVRFPPGVRALPRTRSFIGVFAMFGLMSLFGVRLNFLNYIALTHHHRHRGRLPFQHRRPDAAGGVAPVARRAADGERRGAVLVHHDDRLRRAAALRQRGHPLVRRRGGARRDACIGSALVVVPALVLVAELWTARRVDPLSWCSRHVARGTERRTRWPLPSTKRAASAEACSNLTESNPTRAGIPYAPGIVEALGDARGLHYEPSPFGSRARARRWRGPTRKPA